MSEPCAHEKVSAVELVLTNEIVGHVCIRCLRSLPSQWATCDHQGIDISRLGEPHKRYLCRNCGGQWTEGPQ